MSRCKKDVPDSGGFRFHQCSRTAIEGGDYCKQHDPEARKAREAKRQPTKWDRQKMMRQRFDALLATLESQLAEDIEQLAYWSLSDYQTPGWPLPSRLPSEPKEEA